MRPTLVEVDAAGRSSVDRQAVVTAAFEAYHAELFSFLRRSTRDEAAAEDLVQDAYLRLSRELDAGRSPENVRAWLYRVASNLAVSRARRRMTVVDWMARHGRRAAREVAESPEARALRHERVQAVDAVLASLSSEARTALLLSGEGFTGEEIAAAIGRTHAATRTLLSRTRLRVRALLEQGEALT